MSAENRPVSKAQELHEQAITALSGGRLDEGMALLKKALAAASGSPVASSIILNDLGTACWQRGQVALAEKHYTKAVNLAPQNARALGNYGVFLVEQNRLAEGEPLLARAIALMPDHYKIQNDVGRLHQKKGNLAAAERFFNQSIRLNPNWTNARNNLGELLIDMRRYEDADAQFHEALKLTPENAVTLTGLGKVRQKLMQLDEALEYFDRALAADPTLERTWERKLNILERTQRLDEAQEALAQAKAACPNGPRLVMFEAKLLRRQDKLQEALALLEKLRPAIEKDSRGDSPFLWNLLFEMGELYDRVNDIDRAFECIAKANAGEAASPLAQSYDKTELPRRIAILKNDFTADIASQPGPIPGDKAAPVFLIGFPRSGTTLLDQIMSSHPGLRVADERPAVDKMAQRLTEMYGAVFPRQPGRAGAGPTQLAGLADFNASDVPELRTAFYDEHGMAAMAWNGVFVDKLPLNIIQAGLIKRVFPQAKFILALRHPCDSVLSCFMRRFELNPGMVQYLNLTDAANFYSAVFDLWEHYAGIIKPDVHVIHYEDVVANFRPTVGALLEFLGVPWNDAVLEYDKTAREKARISTPSYHQVTQKLYTRASGRWLRYEKHMQDVIPILEPWARKFGYTME